MAVSSTIGVLLMPDTLPQEGAGFQVDDAEAGRLRNVLDRDCAIVWRTLRRLGVSAASVDDATQTVFLTFARRIREIQEGRERAFLIGVCTRVAANVRRQVARRREVAGDPLDHQSDGADTPEELLEAKRQRALLQRALDQLPIEQRAVFVLYEIEGWSLPEVAENLQIPLGTATSRLRRARARFQAWGLAHARRSL